MSLRVTLQYPGDYARIAYLVALADDERRFRDLVLISLLEFYTGRLQLSEAEVNKAMVVGEDKELAGAITDLASLLRSGFLTKPQVSTTQRTERSFEETKCLLFEHQKLVDEVAEECRQQLMDTRGSGKRENLN